MHDTLLKHIWFDMAGTLYRELPDFKAAHNKHRYTTYAQLVGHTDMDKVAQEYDALYAKHGSNSAVFRSLGKPSDYWQRAFDDMDVTTLLQPDPVVIDTLAALKNIVPISIFTNIRAQTILNLLAHLQIPETYFTHILSGDDISERKPALEGFQKIIELTGVPAEQIMYVGDRVDVDIKPARQAGMMTCLVYSESESADYCVEEFSDIQAITNQLKIKGV